MQSEHTLAESLIAIQSQIEESIAKRPSNLNNEDVLMVAVSKTKPKSAIIEAYSCGCRHFGENYVNELFEKSNDPEILESCPDIKWHFIGHLQGNKVNKLLGCPNLYMIQTIDSEKLADNVEKACAKRATPEILKVLIQVNTSEEDSKSGTSLSDAKILFKHITETCSHLQVSGLMTIGYAHHDIELGPNPEFKSLVSFRDEICKEFGVNDLKVSMGMSADFQHAIEMGSTCVRIGSQLFGSRAPKTV